MQFGNMHVSSRLPEPIGLLGATMCVLIVLVSVNHMAYVKNLLSCSGKWSVCLEMLWMPMREQSFVAELRDWSQITRFRCTVD